MATPEKTKNKKATEIPVRIVAKSELSNGEEIQQLVIKKSKKRIKNENKTAPIKSQPEKVKASNLSGQKKKLFGWVTVITIIVIAGWAFYFKGMISGSGFDTSILKKTGKELTNTFQGFGRIFSNIQKINKIEPSSDQKVEEFEHRVFPQF